MSYHNLCWRGKQNSIPEINIFTTTWELSPAERCSKAALHQLLTFCVLRVQVRFCTQLATNTKTVGAPSVYKFGYKRSFLVLPGHRLCSFVTVTSRTFKTWSLKTSHSRKIQLNTRFPTSYVIYPNLFLGYFVECEYVRNLVVVVDRRLRRDNHFRKSPRLHFPLWNWHNIMYFALCEKPLAFLRIVPSSSDHF